MGVSTRRTWIVVKLELGLFILTFQTFISDRTLQIDMMIFVGFCQILSKFCTFFASSRLCLVLCVMKACASCLGWKVLLMRRRPINIVLHSLESDNSLNYMLLYVLYLLDNKSLI